MRLLVRHGINGKEELAIQVAGTAPVGWDIMKQLAWRLDLESPFQIILYLNSTAAILSPVRAISSHMTSTDLEICYLVQNLQVPTAEHYQSLVTALYEKDVVELCHLLGQGLDLTWLTPDGGHTSTLLALAIFRDNDTDAYAYQASRDLRFPRPGVSLTHLLLQALADPNILPPKQQPTTMLELAVELGSSHLVQLLLDAGATVNPEVSVVPPLMIAVLHRHRGNVQLLLDARADPWQAVPIVSLCDHPWYWFGFLSRRESVNVIQISVAQGPVDTVADLLPQSQDTKSPKKAEGTSQSSLDCTAMTEHATLLLNSIIQKYQRSTGPQHMRGCYTSHRWRRILAGLYLPVRIRQELQQPAGLTRPETWLDQVD
jgi:hypothetical protein